MTISRLIISVVSVRVCSSESAIRFADYVVAEMPNDPCDLSDVVLKLDDELDHIIWLHFVCAPYLTQFFKHFQPIQN